MKALTTVLSLSILFSCQPMSEKGKPEVVPEYTLPATHKHNKWSRTIAPVLSVPSGAIVEAFTEEATDAQLNVNSTVNDMANVSFDPIHPLTGPIYVEEAQPGDVLAVTMHKIDVGDWGWSAIFPGFGFLADTYMEPYLKTFKIDSTEKVIHFSDKIKIPTRPFAGVMGVAPDTDSLLSTIPPRANGGNMDDPNIVEGTTVYFPVFVEGALFSIGDAHAVQGLGEVSGTAVESPMRFVFELKLLKGQKPYLNEPQYETDDYYAVTAFGPSIDIATKKAVQYMIEYLVSEHDLSKEDAYILCSLAGDLKIAEVVDAPNMLVTMHISKEVLGVK
ncbi:Acetamidase/formamidase [Reichenbachiella faecimaris]|uniref:Acetamidase/formamidase n=1 Tax=Reichenbachiella faecimaris TaxID=692418 RepID=A0A1W2GEK1_REIFA|nr:acetamidase/formamidase family protein [Reichenbachiella faecimaris]SMD35075.1 Acetamidase/formamidase [Reichenbachiella faecimaris]